MTTARLRPAAIHPELRGYFRWVPNPPIRQAWMLRLMQAGSGRVVSPKMPAGMAHQFVRLGEGAGVHVYRHSDTRGRGAVLWIHGGGYVVGSAAQDHARCIDLARRLDVTVLSAEYRPAPGAPFPGALNDIHDAWTWAITHTDEIGVDPTRVVIAGQSAGGGLAASLVQRVHDGAGVQPVGQWLFCPMLDDRTAADRSLDGVRHYLWDNRNNRVGWRSVLGVEPGADTLPRYAVPARRTDLAGLPATWIGVGDIELFYEEDRRYAAALDRAGVPVVLDVVPGAPHAFESIRGGTRLAKDYVERAERWLTERLADPR
ncbi:alpha/beta hydrolase [Promicromonospora sp. NPDC057488]|uniref:alpha/beta hydrolase n=1 Tax=Promicromonospora sp. NPDC057488 TaxID=3346147 RepID=UPI00367247CB